MPKTVLRFRVILTILLLLQVLVALPAFVTRPAYAVGQLFGCLFWVGLATLTLRGSETARKIVIGLTYLGLGASAFSVLLTFVALVTGGPFAVFAMGFGALSVGLCAGILSSVHAEEFRGWVRNTATERANAKLAAAYPS